MTTLAGDGNTYFFLTRKDLDVAPKWMLVPKQLGIIRLMPNPITIAGPQPR